MCSSDLPAPPQAPPLGVNGAVVPRLQWSGCARSFQCATATAPLDYNQPRGAMIKLSVVKLPAADPAHRVGSLFVNFGGPGTGGGAGACGGGAACGSGASATGTPRSLLEMQPGSVNRVTAISAAASRKDDGTATRRDLQSRNARIAVPSRRSDVGVGPYDGRDLHTVVHRGRASRYRPPRMRVVGCLHSVEAG